MTMRRRGRAGSRWPSPSQELLLRAIFDSRDRSAAAWDQWQSSVDIEAIDSGSCPSPIAV